MVRFFLCPLRAEILQRTQHLDRYKTLECMVGLYQQKYLQALEQALDKGDKIQAEICKKDAISCLKKALAIVQASFPKEPPHFARIQGKLEKITKDVQSEKN